METPNRTRAAVKFVFWTLCAGGSFVLVFYLHSVGQLAEWFYYSAAADGYAINDKTFNEATPEKPALLRVTQSEHLEGRMAVRVKKGDRLPRGANGVIGLSVIQEGKRAMLYEGQVKVMVPWKIEMAKGFKFKDTFKHKGIETYPWAGVFNVLMVFFLGISLGFMAEGLTDLMGMKLEKIQHHVGH